jgi:hypothetical protein
VSKDYPSEWPAVALATKEAAGWRCVRCGHPHERPAERVACDDRCDPARHPGGLNDGRQRVLTVHHLDGDKGNLRWWNLAALCQVCHLQIQGKVKMERCYMFEHSAWFKPYVAGWYAWRYLGVMMSREQVESRLEALLALERVI